MLALRASTVPRMAKLLSATWSRNRIPPFAVHAVVPVPFGAHPHSVHDCYDYDPEHLAAYDAAARSDEAFAQYLETYVYAPADHAGYLEAIGGEAQLRHLLPRSGLGYNPELRRKLSVST